MPANPNSPFGFALKTVHAPLASNYSTRRGMLKGGAGGNSNSIFSGDALKPSSLGYLDVATVTAGGSALGGIAESFEWVSISQQKTVRSLYWPGTPTDANGDITVYFYADSGAIFEAQCLTGPITQGNVGQYCNFNVGAGGRTTGLGNYSSFTVDDSTLTDVAGSLPFRITQLPVMGPLAAQYSQAGYDDTQDYNRVWVQIANLSSPG